MRVLGPLRPNKPISLQETGGQGTKGEGRITYDRRIKHNDDKSDIGQGVSRKKKSFRLEGVTVNTKRASKRTKRKDNKKH